MEILGAWDLVCPPGSPFAWLHLPEPWRAVDFANAAKSRGVVVAPAEAFAAGRRETSHGVRIGLGPPRDRGRLEQALQRLADLLRNGPAQAFGAIV